MHVHSRDYPDVRRTFNSTSGPSPCHIPCILVRGTRKSLEGGQILEKPCYTVYKVPLTKNSLRAPLVARKEVSGRELLKGDYFTVLLFLKKKSRILWTLYRDKTFWAGVSCYLLLSRDEAGSFNLRCGTTRAIYTRKNKTRPAYIRRVLIVPSKTRTSPYKRHITSKIRRAPPNNRC